MDSAKLTYMTRRQNEQIEKTVRKERKRLFNFIRKRVNDEDDAEDILQDVFSQLVEAYRGLETIERVTSWLFRVARNKITDLYRKKKPEPIGRRNGGSDDPEAPELMLEDILPDLSNDPEALYMRDMIWAAIEAAIEELPEAQREVFVWHEFEGISFKEIAEFTGDTENALRMRKYHAVQFLRSRLQIFYSEIND